MTPRQARTLLLTAAGVFSLVYAVWPPDVQADYIALAGALLGFEPVYRAANGGGKTSPEDAPA